MDRVMLENGEINYEKLILKPDWCKGCGICVAFCPTKTLTLVNEKIDVIDIEKCIQCGQCELRCPDYALYVGRKKNEKKS